RAIAGLDPIRKGNLRLVQIPSTDLCPLSVRQRIDRGIGMLSEDRASEGLAHIRSIADNLTYSRLGRHSVLGWLRDRKRLAEVEDWTRKLNVRCRDASQAVGQLSGGNQQKVALGRLLHQEAEILLLDEPTRGVDISSKAEIYRLMGLEAAKGRSILFVSSYLPELFGVCDRLTVMVRGKLGPIRPIAEWTTEEIMAHATGMGVGEAENV
ncbi:MAG: ATP-binding cassette domain-containing protein, partial [Gemmataceae bacterium]